MDKRHLNIGSKNPLWRGGMIKRICKKCGKEFDTYSSRLKIGKGKYCSNLCSNRDNRSGKVPWNKGISFNVKENHWNWKGGISSENECQRKKFKRLVQKMVFERDNYTCQLCGTKGIDLQVDHIQSWSEYPEFRFNIDNCRTLCMDCHYKITYGKPKPKNIKSWGHNLPVYLNN